MARLATILSFGDHADAAPEQDQHHHPDDDAASCASDDSFEFAFARPLSPSSAADADALADDLFAHGRIVPAYPVFRRQRSSPRDDAPTASLSSAATAPPSPDTYCAWAPRSAPGSPARDSGPALPKSASSGQAVPRFRIRDLVGAGAGRRSHSDGKEKFLFLQPKPKTAAAAPSSSQAKPKQPSSSQATKKKGAAAAAPSSSQATKKKGAAAAAPTEMDMATAHRLFYSKPGAGTDRTTTATATKTSYLPYRPAIVGFFAAAHGLRAKHHPY